MGKKYESDGSVPEFITDIVNNAGRRGLSEWSPQDEHKDSDVAALINWRIVFESLTGFFVLKSGWPREPDFPEPEYIKVWKVIAIHAMNHPPESHAKILVKRFIEVLANYHRMSEEGQYLLGFSVHLSEAAAEGDIDIVESVFDEIFENSGTPQENIKYRAFGGTPRSTYWIPVREGDYKEEFLEAAEELYEAMMDDYERRVNEEENQDSV